MNPRWLVLVSTFLFAVGCSSGDGDPVTDTRTETESVETESIETESVETESVETESAGAALRRTFDPAPSLELPAASCHERCAPLLEDPYYGDHNYAVCLCRCTSPTRPPWACGEYM